MESNFTFEFLDLAGLCVVTPRRFEDRRGYFAETFRRSEFEQNGLSADFVQDNESHSVFGTLRGLHLQRNRPQAKLVRAAVGKIYDVAVDLRPESPTFGSWRGVVLSAENGKMLFVPKGFGHGFLVLSETATVVYKCDDYYDPKDRDGILWSDPTLNILWPVPKERLILSDKDKALPLFSERFGR